jgi:hypothetical protein
LEWDKVSDILYTASLKNSDIYFFFFYFTSVKSATIDLIELYFLVYSIKNGLFILSKNESKSVLRAAPHVIVFSNNIPDLKNFSQDPSLIKRIGSQIKKLYTMDLHQLRDFYKEKSLSEAVVLTNKEISPFQKSKFSVKRSEKIL